MLHLDRLSSEALHLESWTVCAYFITATFFFCKKLHQMLHESSSWVSWVVWDECVSCEMKGVVWDELCERTWVKFSERTRTQLHQMPHESSSWVSWVVWDELSEMSCVSWVVRDELCEMSYVSCERRGVVWDELCALCETTWVKLSERRGNAGGGGGEGTEYKPKNKNPHRDVRKKPHSDELCDDVKKSNKKNHVTEIQWQNHTKVTCTDDQRLTCTNDPLLTCTDDPPTCRDIYLFRTRMSFLLFTEDFPHEDWVRSGTERSLRRAGLQPTPKRTTESAVSSVGVGLVQRSAKALKAELWDAMHGPLLIGNRVYRWF